MASPLMISPLNLLAISTANYLLWLVLRGERAEITCLLEICLFQSHQRRQ
jgi:hypothetical protein